MTNFEKIKKDLTPETLAAHCGWNNMICPQDTNICAKCWQNVMCIGDHTKQEFINWLNEEYKQK